MVLTVDSLPGDQQEGRGILLGHFQDSTIPEHPEIGSTHLKQMPKYRESFCSHSVLTECVCLTWRVKCRSAQKLQTLHLNDKKRVLLKGTVLPFIHWADLSPLISSRYILELF